MSAGRHIIIVASTQAVLSANIIGHFFQWFTVENIRIVQQSSNTLCPNLSDNISTTQMKISAYLFNERASEKQSIVIFVSHLSHNSSQSADVPRHAAYEN